MEKYDLSLLTCSDFEKYNGQIFFLTLLSDNKLKLKLITVTEFKNYSPLARIPFSLVFQTTAIMSGFPQGLYTLQHPEGGDIQIFLVPIGPDSNGMRYEAIFS